MGLREISIKRIILIVAKYQFMKTLIIKDVENIKFHWHFWNSLERKEQDFFHWMWKDKWTWQL